ncbi:MAG: hypothetical protein ACE5ID_08000, partial [Acidobacteriota bacterium]
MDQKLGLTLRQGLRLVMTPALQQAIKLLQMSTLDLREEIATELQENPALEEALETHLDPPPEASLAAEVPVAEGDDQTPESFSEVDLDSLLRNYYDGSSSAPRDSHEVPENQANWETTLSRPENLTTVLER